MTASVPSEFPALVHARSNRPRVGIFGNDDDENIEYRLVVHGIVYDLTFDPEHYVVGWYVYDQRTDKMLGGSNPDH